MKTDYGEVFGLSLKAACLYTLEVELVLRSLEASLAVAADLEAERAAVDQHWQHRLERARRQYPPGEPAGRPDSRPRAVVNYRSRRLGRQ